MTFSSLPFVAAAATSLKETAMSAYAGWRAFFFLKKVAMDDWSWTELAEMFTLYLEQSPDSRAEMKRMATIAVGGVLLFLVAHAAITCFVWRRKSSAIRGRNVELTGRNVTLSGSNAVLAQCNAVQTKRIAVLSGRNAVLTGSNDVLTRGLSEAEETISILLEQGCQGGKNLSSANVAASKSRKNDDDAKRLGTGGGRAEKRRGLGTGGMTSVLKKKNIPSPNAVSSGHDDRYGDVRYEVLRQSLGPTASEGQKKAPARTNTPGRAPAAHHQATTTTTTTDDIAAAAESWSLAREEVALASPRVRAGAKKAEQKGRRKPQGTHRDLFCRSMEHCRDTTASVNTNTLAVERMESGVRTQSFCPRDFDKLSCRPARDNAKHKPPVQGLRGTASEEGRVRRERTASREVGPQADTTYNVPDWV